MYFVYFGNDPNKLCFGIPGPSMDMRKMAT
jgi:hypothetical protein